MSKAVVIPAYNEVENLEKLIFMIYSVYPSMNIIVVDDSSKYENHRLKKALKRFKGNLRIIFRGGKLGRGSAVIDGLRYALKNSKNNAFIEMDADLAHNPFEIPLLLAKLDKADMIVGSRYLSKSKIVKWPLRRLIQSRIINLFLRNWLGIKLSDFTNGFRAYSRPAAEFLANQKLREKGFISLSETAYKLKKAGFKIKEVPISFRDRELGESSANTRELMESFVGALRIRLSFLK